MSWNIRHGLGNDGRVDLDRIAEVIAQSGIDVVGLQEVDRGWARSGSVDQVAELGTLTGLVPCFGPNVVQTDDGFGRPAEYGNAVLSRWPIIGMVNHPLPCQPGSEIRGVLEATIEHPVAGAICVATTHLHWGGHETQARSVAARHAQAAFIQQATWLQSGPAILTGDFNAEPGSAELAPLSAPGSGFTDTWLATRRGDPGYTIPADAPERRIDYIWITPSVHCDAIEVIESDLARRASDHLPVVATLALMR